MQTISDWIAGHAYAPFLLALAAVWLLPFKSRLADATVCLALAGIWLVVATQLVHHWVYPGAAADVIHPQVREAAHRILVPGGGTRESIALFQQGVLAVSATFVPNAGAGETESPPGAWVWAVAALVEAALFVYGGLAALAGHIRFEARNGAWAITGTLIILYCLAAFPLLSFSDVAAFHTFVPTFPFPPVLFTCGILFFSPRWSTNALLPLPLLWALAGGPAASPGLPEQIGLHVALFLGAFFLALHPSLRGQGEGRPSQTEAYRIAYSTRRWFGFSLWALILGSGILIVLERLGEIPKGQVLNLNLLLLCGLGLALWLIFPAWLSLWYRYIAWIVARAGGAVWRGVRDYWKGALLLAGAAALLLATLRQYAAHDLAHSAAHSSWWLWLGLRDHQPNENWPLWLFVTALLGWLTFHLYRARKRLVIDPFDVYVEDEPVKKGESGLGRRLENELARIAGVYRVIDEAFPSRSAQVIEVTPRVDDVGNVLQEASSLEIGGFKITTKPLLSLLGFVTSGPRLTGSLHKRGSTLILLAELSGGGRMLNWRVGTDQLTEEEKGLSPERIVDLLVERLAFRITTDLTAVGSPRWQAVRCYTDGLRAYREAQGQNGAGPRLREAERCLIQALKHDQKFKQCHYNLGVVYRRLDESNSAEASFRAVLRESPDHFDACYALAEALCHSERFKDSYWFCKAAISLQASDARAWDLASYTLGQIARKQGGYEVTLPPGDPAWGPILEMKEIATALSWRDLCRRTWQGAAALERSRSTTFLATRNLAVVLSRAGRHCEKSVQVFRQAAWLAPFDPNLRLYEGRTLFWKGQEKSAAAVLGSVVEDGLDRIDDKALLWQTLAQSSATLDNGGAAAARVAYDRFLDIVATITPSEMRNILKFSLEKRREIGE